VNRATYATAPLFLFGTPGNEPHYNHVVMRNFYRWEEDVYDRTRSLRGALFRTVGKVGTIWLFYLGPALTLPLLMLPAVLRDRRLRPLLVAGGVGSIGLILPAWLNAHYAAPMAGLGYAVMLQGLRRLRAWRTRRGDIGLSLARAIPVLCVLMVVIRLGALPLNWQLDTGWRKSWFNANSGMMDRAALLHHLETSAGDHLVIVRYKPDHDIHSEWVYNAADIDHSKVVWAREMDTHKNEKLIEYFNRRHIWLLEADEKPPRLSPYPTRSLAP
jgi:hypothetical protein